MSAYQKGIRPKAGPFKGQRTPKAEQTSAVQALFEQVLHSSRKTGTLRFEYRDPWTLWLELLPEYQARVTGIARRSDTLLLGDYTLREFNQFYAAFLAICAAHEFLCFSWERTHSVYPLDSAVMVRSRQGWTDILSTLSGIPPEKCKIMISDLTFDFARSLDLHIHPFIPLDSAKLKLAVAPHFPLHSRPDENILRVCSILRPDIFDATSLQKEPESLVELQKQCPHRALQGRVPVPAPNPDIDLIIADEESSTVVVAELKWLRKTLRTLEIVDRDAEILKGVSQLQQIRRFLEDNPDYLRLHGKLPNGFDDYQHVYCLLVARDHWLWVEPSDGIAIVEFEAFLTALKRPENLNTTITDLLSYEWLPVEGRDFRIQYERATANGVSADLQVFYGI